MAPSSLTALHPTGFRGFITTPDDADYGRLIARWSPNEEQRPQVVFEPVCEEDVSLAVRYAVANNLEIAVVSGGHSFMAASSSNGGVHIDLRRMNLAIVENEKFGADGTMLVQGGASSGDVADACLSRGTATVLPAVKEVGYTGFTLGGGNGWTVGIMGLAVDQILEARIVLASGEIVTASEKVNPDLLWAIKGAGYNFGVVTSLKIKVWGHPTKVVAGSIVCPASSFEALFEACERYSLTQQPEECLSFVYCPGDPQGNPVDIIMALPCYYGPDKAEAENRFHEILKVPSISCNLDEVWFPGSIDVSPESLWPYTHRASNGTLFTSLSPKVWLPVIERARQWGRGEKSRLYATNVFIGTYDWRKVFSDQRSLGAWPIRSPPENGASSWRDCAVYISTDKAEDWQAAVDTAAELIDLVRAKHEEVTGSTITWRVYPNASLLPGTPGEYIYQENYARLQKLKAKYDPDNVFHKKHPIQPK